VLTLDQPAQGHPENDVLLTATLTAADGRYLGEKSVMFVITGDGGALSQSAITDYAGRATLGNLPLPPGEYTVNVYFNGTIPLHTGEILTLNDARYNPTATSGSLTLLEEGLDCGTAVPDPMFIWSVDHNFVPISISGITGADGGPATLTITGIFQDEPVGRGAHSPDGGVLPDGMAKVRAERDGNGNGRVYHIFFTAVDGSGNSCEGVVRVVVVHDQSDIDAIDEGPLYDSTLQ